MSVSTRFNVPKTLFCPHCGIQMNLTGRGRAPASVVYLCRCCVPMLRLKELHLAQVVRTGNLGFGFVQLMGSHGLGGLRFEFSDCLDPVAGQTGCVPRVGEQVLVLLDHNATRVQRLWRLPQVAAGTSLYGNSHEPLRRRGVVTALKSPEWGFLVDETDGTSYFVHQADVCGGHRLAVGLRVTFLPAQTPKGRKACEVRLHSA